MKKFTGEIKGRIGRGELPPLVGGGIVSSAAYQTFFKGRKGKGKEAKDVMYTVNVLAPMALMRGLMPVMLEGSTVVNMGSAAYAIGRVEYFEGKEEGEFKEGEKVGFMEGMRRYGSTKLILMAGYAFQRKLFAVSSSPFVVHMREFLTKIGIP